MELLELEAFGNERESRGVANLTEFCDWLLVVAVDFLAVCLTRILG